MRLTLEDVAPAAIEAARERIAGVALRTPLLPLTIPATSAREGAPASIWIKLENLQPIGSFKIRGAANAMAVADPAALRAGVVTASAGNMAQGVGWVASARGIEFTVVVPDHAPQTKLDAIVRLGGRVIAVPFSRWWQVIEEHAYPGLDGVFVHPVCDAHVIAGNGTIGLEIADDLPEVDIVLVPYGGGGLISGIARAMKSRPRPPKIIAVEVETAAPLRAAFRAGHPVEVRHTPSFVDGIGGSQVLDAMWPLVRELVDEVIVVSLAEVAAAMRHLALAHRVIAEGAGAAAVAAALSGHEALIGRSLACVVSGGNVDADVLHAAMVGTLAR